MIHITRTTHDLCKVWFFATINGKREITMRGLLLILMSLCATGAMAENAWYAGVGAGMSNLRSGSNLNADVGDIDTWKAGFQLFGGYKLGEQWAVEFGYLDFGEGSETTPGDIDNPAVPDNQREYSAAGIYVNGQYHIPIGSRVSLDLDGGWLFAEAEDVGTRFVMLLSLTRHCRA